jgi:hypothetical protein
MISLSREQTVRSCLVVVLSLVALPAAGRFAGDYDYMLEFELDPRTGSYRPAYTYRSSKGNSTIWLDRTSMRGEAEKPGSKNPGSKNEERRFIQCDWPPGWKVSKTEERALATHPDGTVFTVFASRPASPTHQRDLAAEWAARAQAKYGPMSERNVVSGQFKDSGTFLLFVKANDKGGAALAVIFSGRRALPILCEFPDQKVFDQRRAELRDFLKSIEIKTGKMSLPK